MLTSPEFVHQSLATNLFFLRIMKEHAFFLQVAFPPKNRCLAQQAGEIREELTMLLAEAVELSEGLLLPERLGAGDIVTEYTLDAEQATEYYSGIFLNTRITRMELALKGNAFRGRQYLPVNQIAMLNDKALNGVYRLIRFKEQLLEDVLNCKVFTVNYPLLIEHILREARLYADMLCKLQAGVEVGETKEIAEQEAFWNRIMGEHALFIRGFLDPSEEELFDVSNNFGKEFAKLTKEAMAAQKNVSLIPKVTQESLEAATEIRDFKRQGTEGLLNCKIKSIILPLLGDHVLREANHYIYLLKAYPIDNPR